MALEKRAEQQQQQQDQEPSSCRRSVPVDNDDRLQSHTSTLPNFLYPYSFCGPIPSVFKHPWEFLKHPLVLLFIGFWAAIASGVSLPGGGLVYGVWTNAITGEYDPDYKMERSRFTGWVMTLVGVGAFLLSWLFLYCCKYPILLVDCSIENADIYDCLSQQSPPRRNSWQPTFGELMSAQSLSKIKRFSKSTAQEKLPPELGKISIPSELLTVKRWVTSFGVWAT